MALIYGCMGLADVATAEAAVEAALESAITTFDHADIYGGGRAEAVFGDVLARSAGLRERIVVQTKCGIRPDLGMYDLRGTSIRRRVHESLERLRIDAIDVLLLHRPDPLASPAEIASAFAALRSEGVVARFGVSNMSAAQISHLQRHLDQPLVANQIEMSLHRRDWLSEGTVEFCADHGIALQAWGPLAKGRYTGGQQTPEDRATAALVAALADRHDTTPETIVLWWLQRHPARIVPVVGTTRPDRIRACRDAAVREPGLSHEEWYALWLAARGEPLP